MEEVSEEMARRLSALPGVRGVERMDGLVNSLRVVTHSEVSVRLDTLQARVNLPDANPEAEYSRFETNVRNLLDQQDPFKLERLRVVIRTTQEVPGKLPERFDRKVEEAEDKIAQEKQDQEDEYKKVFNRILMRLKTLLVLT
jgi:hypothetical protein